MQDRAVGLADGQGDGQPAARLRPAEQHVGERLAHGLAGQPGVDHGRHVICPGHEHRHPGVHHDHGPGVHRGDPGHQFVLPAGQREGFPVDALALGRLGRADDHHRGGAAGRGPHRLGDHGVLVLIRRDAERDRQRGVDAVGGPEVEPDVRLLASPQAGRGPDLTGTGHGLHRVGRNGGDRVGDHRAVHGQRELADAGHADQVLPGDTGPVPGEQRDGPDSRPSPRRPAGPRPTT